MGFAVAEPTKSRVAAAASATRLSLGPLFLQALAATTGNERIIQLPTLLPLSPAPVSNLNLMCQIGVTLRSLTLAVKALAPSFGTAMFALGGWLLRLLLRF